MFETPAGAYLRSSYPITTNKWIPEDLPIPPLAFPLLSLRFILFIYFFAFTI